jgi:N-acetylmuramoyl-L-alanine amidase
VIGWRNRQRTDFIVIHCSNTHPDEKDPQGKPYGFQSLERKHRELGAFTCGYHYVIERDGAMVGLRPESAPGNHCSGVNQISLGVCLIGGRDAEGNPASNFTKDQWVTLGQLMDALIRKYPEAEVVGHGNVSAKETTCPSFDVKNWWAVRKFRKEAHESDPANPGAPEVDRQGHGADQGADGI